MKLQIKQPVDKALEALSEQQREVIVLRFGLDGKRYRTLQEIADEYSLTRERIRQIQNNVVKRLQQDDCIRHLASTITNLEQALHACGGAVDEETLCLSCNLATNTEKNYVRLLLDVGNNFHLSAETDDAEKYWYADQSHKKTVDEIMQIMHQEFEKDENNLMTDDEFKKVYKTITASYESVPQHDSIAKLSKKIDSNAKGEWGLRTHPEISLSNLGGFISLVLREAGEPLHFSEISKRIGSMREGKACNLESCHNELVRNESFVLVGRGLYALASMGYYPGTIYDVIVAGMKEKGPMTRDEVIDYVRQHRRVQPQSVILSLYKKDRFMRDDSNRYHFVEKNPPVRT